MGVNTVERDILGKSNGLGVRAQESRFQLLYSVMLWKDPLASTVGLLSVISGPSKFYVAK